MSDPRIAFVLFADDMVPLDSSDRDLQRALGWRASEYQALGMRISVPKLFVWFQSELLPHVKELKYLRVLFASKSKMEQELDGQISAV